MEMPASGLPTMRQTSQAAHSETDQELLPPHEGWDQHAEHTSCLVKGP